MASNNTLVFPDPGTVRIEEREVPEGVSAEEAAFCSLAAIAMNGVRHGDVRVSWTSPRA